MPEFLRLPPQEQGEIVSAVSAQSGRSSQVLYKDIWVCWALRELFSRGSDVRMAFKGGTSLSKVFQAIHRFSEDVDITLDYRDLSRQMRGDIFSETTSRNARKRYGESLAVRMREYVYDVIHPALSEAFLEATSGAGHTEVSENGEKLWLHYPAVVHSDANYVGDWILIEFGGRNVTEPNATHDVIPFIAERLPRLDFPIGNVKVLSPERTFWEKATMMHVECHRRRLSNPNRISRHWYDLVMLYHGDIGKAALSNRSLLEEVVRHKSAFFNASYAHYQDCLAGRFKLVPEEPFISGLEKDYAAMQSAGMFEGAIPRFGDLIEALREIEERINR